MNDTSPGELVPVTGSDVVSTLRPSALPVLVGDLSTGGGSRDAPLDFEEPRDT